MSQVHSLLILGVYANRKVLHEKIKKRKWIETRNKTFLFLFRCDKYNFNKLPNVLVESFLNQRCQIASIYVLETKLLGN